MPVFLQNPATREFVAPKGRWTRNIEKAICFEQVLRAWEEIGERGLSEIEIVIRDASSGLSSSIQRLNL